MPTTPQLEGYPPELQAQAQELIARGKLKPYLLARYPEAHQVQSNKQLFDYVQDMKKRHMRNTAPLGKVQFDSRMRTIKNALGLHITSSIAHSGKLHKRRELRVASLFKTAPAAFLRMIVVHELAHMKHATHNRDFYKLCCNMEPEYHQLEFDLRLFLCLENQQGDPAQ